MYKIACGPECEVKNACVIEFDDDTIIETFRKELESGSTIGTKSLWLLQWTQDKKCNSEVPVNFPVKKI